MKESGEIQKGEREKQLRQRYEEWNREVETEMEEGKEITMANTNKYDKKGEREENRNIAKKGREAYGHTNKHTKERRS